MSQKCNATIITPPAAIAPIAICIQRMWNGKRLVEWNGRGRLKTEKTVIKNV